MALSGDYAGSTGEKILTTSGLKALVAKINGLKDTWTKDTFLDSVSTLSDENKVTFTWNTGSGKTATTVDFGKLVDIYKLENAASDTSITIDGDGSNANPWKISTKGNLIPLGISGLTGTVSSSDTVGTAIQKLNTAIGTLSGNVGELNFCKTITGDSWIKTGGLTDQGDIKLDFVGDGSNINLGANGTNVTANKTTTKIVEAIENAYLAAKTYVDTAIGKLPDDKDTTYTFSDGTDDGTFIVKASSAPSSQTVTIGGFAALKSTVGNAQSGLVKTVNDLSSKVDGIDGKVTANGNNIESLQTTVGNAQSGLVKDVNSLKNDMTTVKGYETRIAALESAKSSLEERVAKLEEALARIMTDGDVDTIWDDTKLTW